MSPAKIPSERLTDRKRQAILEAAIAEFRAQGFDGASMDGIALHAQVSKRTVYNHFPSKDALFEAMLEQLWAASAARLSVSYRADRPLREQLLELLGQKLAMMAEPQFLDLARVLIAQALHAPQRARDMLARLNDREEPLGAWVRAAMADGRLASDDAELASQQLQGLLKGQAFWPQLTLGQAPLDEAQQARVAATSADLFLSHYARARA